MRGRKYYASGKEITTDELQPLKESSRILGTIQGQALVTLTDAIKRTEAGDIDPEDEVTAEVLEYLGLGLEETLIVVFDFFESQDPLDRERTFIYGLKK